MSSIMSLLIIYSTNYLLKNDENYKLMQSIMQVSSIILFFIVNFSYLMTAFLDPGIYYKPKQYNADSEEENI